MDQPRREFLAGIFAGLTVTALDAEKRNDVPYRELGRTGEKVSIVGLGGYHLGNPSAQEATRIVRTAVDNGINFMDNCWDYHDGESERRMGDALRDGYRKRVFLMTKIDSHSKDGAARQIEQSLKRLQTDMIDLVQFHEVIRQDDPERIFSRGGSMEAMLAAQKAGKLRYIGFTGHKSPDIHLKMIQTGLSHSFTFDTVQMPLNLFDAHYESFGRKVLPAALQHRIGVLGMKPMGAGFLLQSHTAQPKEFLQYAMNLKTSVVITGCESMRDVEQALDAARTFRPMNEQQVAALLDKTHADAQDGKFEEYKTTRNFDGTVHNPQWLA